MGGGSRWLEQITSIFSKKESKIERCNAMRKKDRPFQFATRDSLHQFALTWGYQHGSSCAAVLCWLNWLEPLPLNIAGDLYGKLPDPICGFCTCIGMFSAQSISTDRIPAALAEISSGLSGWALVLIRYMPACWPYCGELVFRDLVVGILSEV